jgi:hypothetical protein
MSKAVELKIAGSGSADYGRPCRIDGPRRGRIRRCKSTLRRCVSGLYEPDAGEVRYRGRSTRRKASS